MPNKLANENSPYLLQHVNNPVEWYPWGEEALERARQEDKPIFLSIGYAACHWCHVMAHESFENTETARLMNEHFVNIKVDREERPDLDNIYMDAVVAMTGQGGWPMSVFLTPDGRPFYGGTYFPPSRRYGMPGFREVLQSVAQAWEQEREKLVQSGQEISDHLQKTTALSQPDQELKPGALRQAVSTLAQTYDWEHGGWGAAPKFPQPMVIEFLLRQATRNQDSEPDEVDPLKLATHALKVMAQGGMYDVVGGGFARYSIDADWLVPHFEKMLYDNAQLARVYLHGYLLTGEEYFRQVCEETLEFVLREMTNEGGGFYSSLDADSEGEEGKYYVWTPDQVRSALPDLEEQQLAFEAYSVTKEGNFEGANVLQQVLTDEKLAGRYNTRVEDIRQRLKDIQQKLLAERQKRVRPGTDDKVLVSWNALMLIAFAEAARYLSRPRYLEAAQKNATFLINNLREGEQLFRSWREGRARHQAYLEDYAGLILGLLALYQSDPDVNWFWIATNLTGEVIERYQDPEGGFYDTSDLHEPLLRRPKELQDNAVPSGNSLAASAFLELSAFTGRGDWRELAERMIAAISPVATRYPTAFGRWLSALDFAIGPVKEVAIVGDHQDDRRSALVGTLWSGFRPRLVAAVAPYPPPANAPAILADRPLKSGKPTAYVCEHFICKQPVTTVRELEKQLEQNHESPKTK